MINHNEFKLISPILKWAGGKTQILDNIFNHFPNSINTYYEPFIGGGSVFLQLLQKIEKKEINVKRIILGDINENLIYLYEYIKDNVEKLIEQLTIYKKNYESCNTETKRIEVRYGKTYKDELSSLSFSQLKSKNHNITAVTKQKLINKLIEEKKKQLGGMTNSKLKSILKTKHFKTGGNKEQLIDSILYSGKPYSRSDISTSINITKNINYYIPFGREYIYYYYRQVYNTTNSKLEKAALLLFLNKTCFRGVYREGPNGFNVPYGHNANPAIFKEKQLRILNRIFNTYNVQFYNKDFYELCKHIKSKDFVYFDPPYYPLKNTSFTTYNRDGFETQHKILVSLCKKLNSKNIKFMHSNSWCEFNITNYPYKQEKIECSRRINSKNPSDTDYEIIIWN